MFESTDYDDSQSSNYHMISKNFAIINIKLNARIYFT